MPIEVNRVNKECPRCKNPTIFDTGKNYFCGKCLIEIPKPKTAKETVPDEVRAKLGIPDDAVVEEMEEVKCDIHQGNNDQMCTRCGKEKDRHAVSKELES